MKHEPDQAAPNNWISIVNDRGDLDLAFEALDGWDHFHTDTIRGRLRSLQLRPQDAWPYFERAEGRADEYGRSLRNLLRRFYLRIYRFENALIQESEDEGGDPGLTDRCLKDLLRVETPDSETAMQLLAGNRGMYYLHREDYAGAKKIFRKLIWDSRDRLGDEKTGFYTGAAAAHRALGEYEEADRQVENACLYIPTLENTFNMGFYASVVSALLKLWDRESDSQEWEHFLGRLKLPRKTSDVFQERSRRILSRTASLKRIFLF